jgi:TolB protein
VPVPSAPSAALQSPSLGPSPSLRSIPRNASPGLDRPSDTIAFSARIDSPTDGDIYTVGIDGTNLRRVTSSPANEYSASWSPDGREIVFRSAPSSLPSEQNPSDIAVVTLVDLGVKFLTHDAALGNWSPAWSPDGQWIAYYSGGVDRSGLYLIRPDGSENHRILAGDAEYPSWSPNGRRLAFMSLGFPPGSSSSDYDIYAVDVDGGNLQRLTRLAGEDGWPAWSHDGTRIGYTRIVSEAESEIQVMMADGSDDHAITDPSDGLAHEYPSWSRTDQFLAYSAYPQADASTAVGGMFVTPVERWDPRLILPDGVGPAWQPVQ